MGRYHFRNPLKRFVFRLIGAIPKEQFFPDFASILEMKRVIERGEVLFLFPSGQSSYTGECTYIPEGIGRLLKRLNAPVLHVHIEGAHLTYPKWDMSRKRKTAVHATVAPLFERVELKQLDAHEVYARVCEVLYFGDYEWQRAHMLAAKAPRGVVEHKDSIEAYADGELYRFVPSQKITAYKFAMLGEVLYKRARIADAGAPGTGHDVPA